MRTIPASLAMSSIILGGWLTGAHAQTPPPTDTPPEAPTAANQPADDADTTPPGEIPVPTLDVPGLTLGVMAGLNYTDNVRLSATDAESSLLAVVQPFVQAAHAGPRFSGTVNYSLTGYLYFTGPANNQVAQSLNANGTLVLVPQHLFLDGSAQYGRQAINNALPSGIGGGFNPGFGSGPGSGSFFLDNNQTNVATFSLSPYWMQDLGNVGTMTVRYAFGRVVYTDRGIPAESQGSLAGIPNVTSNSGQFSIVSPEGQRWGWNLGYSQQRLSPDFGTSTTFALAQAGTSYELNPSVRLLADIGKETQFLPDGTTEKLGASFWDAGFEWTGDRDHVRATAGHRFFGTSFQFSWSHTAARLTTNVSYTQQPTTYNQQLLGQGGGIIGLPPINLPPSNIPSLTEINPYLSKRLTASATYSMPRSTLNAAVYNELRTYFYDDDADERVASANLSWAFFLGPRTSLTPGFWWQRYRFQTGQVNYNRYLNLSLSHQFNEKNFGQAQIYYRNGSVQSGVPGAHGFNATTIFVNWTHLF